MQFVMIFHYNNPYIYQLNLNFSIYIRNALSEH